MTTLTLTLRVSVSDEPAWIGRSLRWLAAATAEIWARSSAARTRALLERLDDATLADIGLPRLDQFGRPASRDLVFLPRPAPQSY